MPKEKEGTPLNEKEIIRLYEIGLGMDFIFSRAAAAEGKKKYQVVPRVQEIIYNHKMRESKRIRAERAKEHR